MDPDSDSATLLRQAAAEGDPARREFLLRALLKRDPSDADALVQLGRIMLSGGRFNRARRTLLKALESDPASTAAHLGLAELARRRGRDSEAIAQLQQLLRTRPQDIAALCDIAAQAQSLGALGLALDAFGQLLMRDPGEPRHWRACAELLRFLQVDRYDEALDRLLLACLQREDLDHQDLVGCIMSLLRAKPGLAPFFALAEVPLAAARLDEPLHSALKDPLLRTLLRSAIVADLEFERALTCLRSLLLDLIEAPATTLEPLIPLAVDLAGQCFLTEYVYSHSATENERQEALSRQLKTAALGTGWRYGLAVLACYRPLTYQADLHKRLSAAEADSCAGLEPLLRQQWEEPRAEAEIATGITSLTAIDDETSKEVRRFYEETPYPRWTSLKAIEPRPLGEALSQLFPTRRQILSRLQAHPRVLIAGCGTGRQALLAAQFYADAELLAIDLSRTSLAYAQRKARDACINNVTFRHADLLALDAQAGSFDLIECSGVLVCLEDPVAGLRSLARRLVPGGVLKLGLYSETARRHIVRARAFIDAEGYQATPADIRACRQAIAASADPQLASVAAGRDFFSTSMVRDLIFHIKEHRFSLDWIAGAAADLDLEILGLEINDPISRQRYRALNPGDPEHADLGTLARLEAHHPETFAEMYQVWLRKPDRAD